MAEEPRNEKRSLDLSATQLIAGALAAVSSAVAASFFGVAGTLLGAAVGSVIGTVATAVYKASLSRTGEKVREIVPIQTVTLRARRGTDDREAVRFAGGTEAPAHPASATGSIDSAPTDLPDGTSVAGTPPSPERREAGGWRRTAVLALASFVVALAVVTAVELLGGRPLSALVTGGEERGTTVGRVAGPGAGGPSNPAPSPSGSVSPTPTGSPTPSATVSSSVSPSVVPSAGQRSSPSPMPTAAPLPTAAPSAS